MAPPRPPPPLLYGDTARYADVLYFGRVAVPDPFLAFAVRGKKYAVVSALEFNRVRHDSDFDRVLSLEACQKRIRDGGPRRAAGPAEVMALLAGDFGQRRFTVPADFPAGLYRRLRRRGLDLVVAAGPLFPERAIKSAKEAGLVREGNRCAARGIAAAEAVLRASRIRGRNLLYRGSPLTSERLRSAIDLACLEAGGIAAMTIAAGGDQACDPHEGGHGPLRPNELIIVDVFPRIQASGYYGDMTRTFLRGRASDAQHALVAAVRDAQSAALGVLRAGAEGRAVHAVVEGVFAARGYQTGKVRGRNQGFFHGTGHGVGLEIHEPPRVSRLANQPLPLGTVVTIEPGLYYPGLGGCRIEDVAQVTAGAPRLLSSYPYVWEI